MSDISSYALTDNFGNRHQLFCAHNTPQLLTSVVHFVEEGKRKRILSTVLLDIKCNLTVEWF